MNFLKKIILKISIEVDNLLFNYYLKHKTQSELSKIENLKKSFGALGINSVIPLQNTFINPQYIYIGNHFQSLYNLRLEAWDCYYEQKFTPYISIGDNVSMNTDIHIGCINRIEIGNYVMLASRVYISDHSHGNLFGDDLKLPPVKRPLVSKGPVVIEDNVWIGEGACIMPGVRIGKNAIIGANSVVTKDVPANAVMAGVPAKVLRYLEI